MNKLFRGSLAVLLSLGIGSQARAVGSANIANEVPSARAAGQGYVGVAGQNNDPTVVYSNPAAMTKLKGTQVTFGAHWENIHGSFETDAGAETKARTADVVVPNVSATQSFMDGKVSAGLTIQSPFGLETHWPNGSPMQYVATNSRLGMMTISPAVAYQIHPTISIGAGVDYVDLFQAQLDRQVWMDAVNVGLGGAATGAPDAVSSLRGQGKGWGYHVGLLFEPYEKHAFGLAYHSKVNVRVNGNATLTGLSGLAASAIFFNGSNYSTSAYTDVNLPSNLQLGYAFKPNDKWTLETNAAWFHWSSQKDLNVRFPVATATQAAVLNVGNPTKFDLRDAWSFASGANYKATDRLQVRGGFWYEPWAQPESTFTPAFLDLSRYGLSAGLGYDLTQNLTLDFAYVAVFMHNRHIHNNVGFDTTSNPAVDIDGTYKDFANLVALNLTYRFGKK